MGVLWGVLWRLKKDEAFRPLSAVVASPENGRRTETGDIEEDIIKCLAYRGDFSLSCADLRSKGLNRVGQIADKVTVAGFYVAVPDFFYGIPMCLRCHYLLGSLILSRRVKGCEDVRKVVADLKSKGASAVGVAGFCWGGAVDSYKDDDEHVVKCAMEAHTDLLNWFTKYLK
ncbi:hypothetical protein L1987_33563 [Smallanthus sonchifolius]|uniref:Uncharacterized protein n=1 Tax=Smallanthus sonchifolius TaxID=185202 RepID=A0ACB9HR50_9ASTR|nr:hypothetical protein L1987_33563 [Smallanthus sonchifolius]